jgi:hypothetical protein
MPKKRRTRNSEIWQTGSDGNWSKPRKRRRNVRVPGMSPKPGERLLMLGAAPMAATKSLSVVLPTFVPVGCLRSNEFLPPRASPPMSAALPAASPPWMPACWRPPHLAPSHQWAPVGCLHIGKLLPSGDGSWFSTHASRSDDASSGAGRVDLQAVSRARRGSDHAGGVLHDCAHQPVPRHLPLLMFFVLVHDMWVPQEDKL